MSGCNWLQTRVHPHFDPAATGTFGTPCRGREKKFDVKHAFLLRGPASMLHPSQLRGGKNFVDMVTLRINYRFGWGAARLNLARRN